MRLRDPVHWGFLLVGSAAGAVLLTADGWIVGLAFVVYTLANIAIGWRGREQSDLPMPTHRSEDLPPDPGDPQRYA